MNVNPVLQRELRERMRGPRAMFMITGYLGLLVGIFFYVYQAQAGGKTGLSVAVAPTEVAQIGRGIFEWVLFFMMLLVLFLVPGLTSGAIAGERERQTLIPMQVTMLKPRSIVIGKIMASLAFLFLLIIASFPLFALSYLIGGISLVQAVEGLGVVVVTGIVYACITVGCSAVAKRVQTATVLAYGVVLFTVMGTFLIYAAAGIAAGEATLSATASSKHPPAVILITNPLAIAAAVIARDASTPDLGTKTNSPMEPIRRLVEPLRRDGTTSSPSSGGGSAGTTIKPAATTIPGFISGPGPLGLGGGGFIQSQPGTTAGTTPPPADTASVGGTSEPPTFAPFVEASAMLMIGLAIGCIWLSAIRLRIPAEVER